MKTLHTTLLIFIIIYSYTAIANTVVTDMCPQLPKEIASKEPKYASFVTVKSSHSSWQEQYEAYEKAIESFELKYKYAFEKLESEWQKLEESQSASQNRFYELIADDKDEKLFKEIKSICWSKVMGIDEVEKDNFCNPLLKPPSDIDRNDILICVMDRATSLNIKIK
jgi:hypothetical protein